MKTVKDIKEGDVITLPQGDFKVVNVNTVFNPYSFYEERVIIVDMDGEQKKVKNSDIMGIK